MLQLEATSFSFNGDSAHFNARKCDKSAPNFVERETDLETAVFPLQFHLLCFFGFKPPSKDPVGSWRVADIVRLIMATAILTAAVTELVYQFSVFICELGTPSDNDNRNVLLLFLAYGPYMAESLRGTLVLVLLVTKRKQWRNLSRFAAEIVAETFPDAASRKTKLFRWKTFTVVFGVATVFLHLTWEGTAVISGYGYVFWPEVFGASHHIPRKSSLVH